MKFSLPKLCIGLAAIVIPVIVAVFVFPVTRKSSESPKAFPPTTNSTISSGAGHPQNIPVDFLANAAQKLHAATNSQLDRATLNELRAKLASLSPDAAAEMIRQTLNSRVDAPTGLEFKLVANGSLGQPPTLRLFLLDQLAQLNPAAAASYAEKILGSPDSPDEWALALRSYALGQTNSEARVFLQKKFREMMGQDSWRVNPSVGFLEAFDVAVYSGGTELLPDITGLLRDKDNKAVSHAAYLALDRLVISEPAVILGQLQQQPESMAGREATRADFFGRADVRDSQQKTLLENYLLDPNRSAAELQRFAGVYPNANYMVSHNLLTQTVTPTGAELAARDREALKVVEQWLADPRFAGVKPHLQTIKGRLDQFVKQAGGSQP